METRCVQREDIRQILLIWQRGELTEKEVWDWANSHYFPGETEFDDWENDNSASNEILQSIDGLDMNLILVEDVPIYLEFINSKIGEFEKAHSVWAHKLKSIDYKERRKSLKEHPIYGPFCK